MERPRQDLLLGLVFFTGLGVLIWATMTLSGPLFVEQEERVVAFPRAAGLRAGDNVYVLGHRLGQVKTVRYHADAEPGRQIEVVVLLDEPVRVTDRYRVTIEEGNLLGGRLLEIDPGDGEGTVGPEAVMVGAVRSGALAALGDIFDDPDMKGDLKGIVSGLRQAVDRLNSGDSSVGKLFTDSSLHDELLATITSARRSFEEIETGRGAAFRLIHDEQVGDRLASVAERLDQIVAKIDAGDGLIARVLNDRELAEDGAKILDDLSVMTADLRDGQGPAGLLLRDAETAGHLQRITSGFAQLADNVNDPTAGAVGALVADAETRGRLVQFVDDIADLGHEVRHGRGLVSRMIYEEDLGEQFARILNQISRAIEDVREAAPVSTFFTVFTGAF
jgi:ABC-type transporter Mla subunit MlaD